MPHTTSSNHFCASVSRYIRGARRSSTASEAIISTESSRAQSINGPVKKYSTRKYTYLFEPQVLTLNSHEILPSSLHLLGIQPRPDCCARSSPSRRSRVTRSSQQFPLPSAPETS